ncbi:variable surface protein [Plasmodium gonderi]|uniref:Variable surface protein n=1 Tax=Plasmodium gonderi TaxID=77519 RepID=A0A1Y1JTT5_PLAGO|nr:variable surface protein [Plasmodium gonderi]GAW84527.1 variable surface protein [Plasmodium gonderi]
MAEGFTYPFDKGELTSVKYYNMLDTGVNRVKDNNIFCSPREEQNKLDAYPEIKNFCSQLRKYLINERNNHDQYMINSDLCNLLSYWLYEQLVEKCKIYQCDAITIYNKISNIFATSSGTNSLYSFFNCQLDPYIYTHEDWEKRKKVFDYCQNFDTIKNTYPTDKEKCRQYHDYILDISNLYNNFKNECTFTNVTKKCPVKKFYTFDNCNPTKLLNDHRCDTIQAEEVDNSTESTQNEDTQSEDIQNQDTPTEIQLKEQMIYPEEDDHIVFPSIKTMSHEEPQLMNENHNTLKIFGKILLGGIVTSLLVGVLYKVNTFLFYIHKSYKYSSFTAIGNKLRNIIPYRKNNISHLNNERNELYNDASAYIRPYYEDSQDHYVGYSAS